MSWQDLPGAPAPGTPVCHLDDITPGRHHTLELNGFPLLLIRNGNGLLGYVNLCPHQYLPLDFHGPHILSADGESLICSAHQARFDARTGAVTGGPAPCGLDGVPLEITGDLVRIGNTQSHH
ncbi:MAG: Rieske (2Fe-2S) protein [Paracoccus sp. (in: a-proteobacteria)]|nr:Rieske (2Fe-2S) protein [Paracoccus sp. (in: a-proteobacteria)]